MGNELDKAPPAGQARRTTTAQVATAHPVQRPVPTPTTQPKSTATQQSGLTTTRVASQTSLTSSDKTQPSKSAVIGQSSGNMDKHNKDMIVNVFGDDDDAEICNDFGEEEDGEDYSATARSHSPSGDSADMEDMGTVSTREGIEINLLVGSICELKVDVIVNSIADDLDLSKGALSKAILQHAGPMIQMELYVHFLGNKSLKYSEVVLTKGHELPCKHVLHGVCPQWDGGKGPAEHALRQFLKNILQAADKLKAKSVAIPAIGAGILRFPSTVVAKCMFDEILKFSSDHRSTTLERIVLIVFNNQPMVTAIEERMQDMAISDSDSDSDDSDDMAAAAAKFGNLLAGAMLGQVYQNLLSGVHANQMKSTVALPGMKFPSTWSAGSSDKPYRKVALAPSSDEYKAVMANISKSGGAKVHTIERIENVNMYQVYAVRRDGMNTTNGSGVQNERTLFHGTSINVLEQIFVNGFNRSYCGKNATRFGKGVYFARDFSYSSQDLYSPLAPDGKKYVFQCLVLTGEFTLGAPEMIEPPEKQGAAPLRYDSVVNDLKSPAIFVIFRDPQVYPEYLITFVKS